MDQLLERLAALTGTIKLTMLAMILAAAGGIYYQFFYSGLTVELNRMGQRAIQLRNEKSDYEKRKKQYLAYRNEVNDLLEQQKELLRVLPRKDDIEQFIESVNAQVELAGLSRVASTREPGIPEEMYVRIPIRMSAVGSYHQINRFFRNIGELKRIVTIGNLKLEPAVLGKDSAEDLLRADFVAQTFQFVDRPGATGALQPGGSK